MWTVVYMAQGKDMATKIQQALEEHGILVKVKPIGKDGSGKDNCYEILVPAAGLKRHTI